MGGNRVNDIINGPRPSPSAGGTPSAPAGTPTSSPAPTPSPSPGASPTPPAPSGTEGGGIAPEISVSPEKIQDLANELDEKVCEPLKKAAEEVEEAEPDAFAWGGCGNSMFAAHSETRSVVVQNLLSWADKTIREEVGDRLGITAKNWKAADEASKPAEA